MKRIINFKSLVFLLIIFCGVSFSGQSLAYAQDKIVAIVNNEVVTRKDLDDFLNFMRMQLSQEYKGKELEAKLASAKIDLLNRLIEDRLILQEASKEKLTYDVSRVKAKLADVKKRYNSEIEFQNDLMRQGLTQADIEKRIREQFLMFIIVEQKVRSKVTVDPDDVTDFYEQNKKDFVTLTVRDLDAFAFEDGSQAKSFANSLKNGEKSEDLALKYAFTMNTISSRNGETLKQEIDEVVSGLGENEISSPVKIQDKYYVFRVTSLIPPRELSLSEAQDEIHAFLLEKKSQEKLASWLDELKKKSYIKIR